MELANSKTLLLVKNTTWWSVVVAGLSKQFWDIEAAAEYMESLGIQDQDIDDALVEMTVHRRLRAVFTDGKLSHTKES